MKRLILALLLFSFAFSHVKATMASGEAASSLVVEMADSAIYMARTNMANAESIAQKALSLAESIDSKYGSAKANFALGYINQVNNKLDKGIIFYLVASSFLDDLESKEAAVLNISCHKNIGMIFNDHHRFDQAIEYYGKSIELAKKWSLPYKETVGRYFTARSFRADGEYLKAIDELYVAAEIAEDEGFKEYLVKINTQLGLLFKDIGDFENALKHNFKVFAYKTEVKNFSPHEGKVYHNVANIFLLQGDEKKAEQYFLKAIDAKMSVGGLKKAFISHLDLAELYKDQGRFILAGQMYNKALEAGLNMDGDQDKFKIHKQLADLSYKMGDMDAYLKYNQNYMEYLEKDIILQRDLVASDQQYSIHLVTQRYFELLEAKQREKDLKRWGLWAALIILLSIATYATISKIRAYRMKKILERELKDAMMDFNIDDL